MLQHLTIPLRRPARFPELSYANPADPRLKQWVIRRIEQLSGRDRLADLYDIWRCSIVGRSSRVMGDMLDLLGVRLEVRGIWPPAQLPDTPLVLVANHPYGIGDGVAILSLAEQLGRPFRVMINDQLLKVPEIRPYALPVNFDETREGIAANIAMRHEAMRLLRDRVTIVVFPAGAVASAPRGFGEAQDAPWKLFPARLIQAAGASVVPIYFEGQNGRLFHLVSKVSLTVRLSLLIHEFRRLSGRTMTAHVGPVLSASDLAAIRDRKALTAHLHDAVFRLRPARRAARPVRTPADTRLAA